MRMATPPWPTTCPDCGEEGHLNVYRGTFIALEMRLDAEDGFIFSDAKEVSTEDERVRCTQCNSEWGLAFLCQLADYAAYVKSLTSARPHDPEAQEGGGINHVNQMLPDKN
jgi:hypothetical protein